MKSNKTNMNPFSPGKILVDSTRYAGRDKLIVDAYNYLRDYRSVFITGQRGVGKSSFAMQVRNLINKEPSAFERFDVGKRNSLNTLIVNYRCAGDEKLQDIVVSLLGDLSKKLKSPLLKTEKISTSWKLDLKFVSHESQLEESLPTPAVTKEFSEIIIEAYENHPVLKNDGICFMIDEIDILVSKIELGIFIKVFLENLSDNGIQNVTFVLVGISKGLSALKLQHPSITRYLVPLYVPPMTNEEQNEIIDRALSRTEIIFDEKICEAIHMLSLGFPDPVHLIGYELFNHAKYNSGEVNFRIFESVLKKITTIIKREEFLNIRNKIPDRECERLLLEMAKLNDEMVSVSVLAKRINETEDDCNDMCKMLAEYDFLEQHGLGTYRFMDPLFRVYLNMINVESEAKAERAKMFSEITNMANQIPDINPKEEERKMKELFLYKIILRNYKETGKTGFW